MNHFDYSQVPYNYGVCASTECPKSTTCLRHIALEHAPAKPAFLPTLTPAALKAMKGDCPHYRPNKPIRYAQGFVRLIGLLQVNAHYTFRGKLILRFGRKNYYLARKGELPIHPDDQAYIIQLAKELQVETADYFDSYFDGYDW